MLYTIVYSIEYILLMNINEYILLMNIVICKVKIKIIDL